MEVINIKNGVLLGYTRNYSIYEMYTEDMSTYYMCIANYDTNRFETIIDFPEEYFNSLRNEEKLEDIGRTCNSLYSDNHPYIYILPNITTYDISEAEIENDNHAYEVLLRKLQKYTYSIYKSITNNNENITIDSTIQFIVDTEEDRKFIDWLEINLNSYVKPRYLDRKKAKEITNDSKQVEEKNQIVKEESNVKTRKLVPDNRGFSSIGFIVGIIFGAILLWYVFLR